MDCRGGFIAKGVIMAVPAAWPSPHAICVLRLRRLAGRRKWPTDHTRRERRASPRWSPGAPAGASGTNAPGAERLRGHTHRWPRPRNPGPTPAAANGRSYRRPPAGFAIGGAFWRSASRLRADATARHGRLRADATACHGRLRGDAAARHGRLTLRNPGPWSSGGSRSA
jgi:hypothetical protein